MDFLTSLTESWPFHIPPRVKCEMDGYILQGDLELNCWGCDPHELTMNG